MPSFGEKLKLEREKRKITLDQISASTKISNRMLQAIEEDKFNQLPGGIFNKGFVRAYARAVGLDEDQTIAEYLQASGDAPVVRPELLNDPDADDHAEIADAPEHDSRPLPWGWFAAGLLVLALALTLWSHHRREQEKQSSSASPSAVNTENSAGQNPISSSTTQNASSPGPAPSPNNSSFSNSTVPSSSATSSTSTSSTASTTNPAAAPAPGEFTVTITAREESWISITADGKPAGSELLEADNERTVHGHRQIVVKAGNAGGVEFKFNGKKVSTAGDFGEVRTLSFAPTGLISNTTTDATP